MVAHYFVCHFYFSTIIISWASFSKTSLGMGGFGGACDDVRIACILPILEFL